MLAGNEWSNTPTIFAGEDKATTTIVMQYLRSVLQRQPGNLPLLSISNCLGIFYIRGRMLTGLICFPFLSEELPIQASSPPKLESKVDLLVVNGQILK